MTVFLRIALRAEGQAVKPEREPVPADRGSSRLGWLTAWPVPALLTLYLIAGGRWGSYVTYPGVPFYIADIGVGLALVQAVISLHRRQTSLGALRDSPLVLLLVAALLCYAAVRFAFGLRISLVGLRDLAPYAYAIVAVLAFLIPARTGTGWRPLIYGTFVFHLLWVVVLSRFPGFPWQLPVLGADAQIFITRPDFDTMILGVGAAFALREFANDRALLGRPRGVLLALFLALSCFGIADADTRAGLLAGLFAISAVIAAQLSRSRALYSTSRGRRSARAAAFVVVGIVAISVLALTPSGSRLVAGFNDSSSGAHGTISARQKVWTRMGDYVLYEPKRTAVGVGFGRDFIDESGAGAALEGIYQNVRSPHNYVLGTLARLGVAGGLLVSVIIGVGVWLGMSQLRRDSEPMVVLAALLAISIPVVALLGVVLESPFGAIPYFWALGQLALAQQSQAGSTVKGG